MNRALFRKVQQCQNNSANSFLPSGHAFQQISAALIGLEVTIIVEAEEDDMDTITEVETEFLLQDFSPLPLLFLVQLKMC